MKLLDTNIFVYAQGGPHPYREPCRSLVATLEREPWDYAVDVELLQEVLHVYTARGQRDLALRTFDRILTLFPTPIAVTRAVMLEARRLHERYRALSARDVIHAAVVVTAGLEGIVTTDKQLTLIQEVSSYDPEVL